MVSDQGKNLSRSLAWALSVKSQVDRVGFWGVVFTRFPSLCFTRPVNLRFFLPLFAQLNINHKKVYRLCNELDVLLPQRKVKKPKHPRRLAKRTKVTGSNQLWQMDLKYGYIASIDRFFFIIGPCIRSGNPCMHSSVNCGPLSVRNIS